VEHLVTDKLEDAIREIAEVETVTSQSKTGVSVIHVELADKYDRLQPLWEELRNKVNDTEPMLPEGAVEPVVNDEFGDVYGILLALRGQGYTFRELEDRAEHLRDEFLEMEGIDKVDLHGVQQERIFVDFSNARLAELGFSPQRIISILRSQNSIQPSGSVRLGPERIVIESTGDFESLEDIRETTLHLPGHTQNIRLRDIAEVQRGYEDPPLHIARFQGERSIVLALSTDRDTNVVQLGERIERRMQGLRGSLPAGLELEKILFQPKVVERSIRDFTINLVEAFVFVVLVMFLFVGWRTGFAAAALIPMAMLGAIMLMPLFGVKLQIVSIGALIVSLGILVDNGVVVSENILVRISSGEDRKRAATRAVSRLWLPLLIASLTTVFAFIPIPLAQSKTGEYTVSLFIVVALTLLTSWILSMTFVPLLGYFGFRPQDGSGKRGENVLYRGYRRVLLAALRRRWLFLLLVAALVGAAGWGFLRVPQVFFPPNEREVLTIDFWQPYGTDIEATEQRAAKLERHLLDHQGVKRVATFVGYGGPRWYLALDPQQTTRNYAFFVVATESAGVLPELKRDIQGEIGSEFPSCRASVRRLMRGPPVGAPIQIRISGDRMEQLYDLRDRIAAIADSVPETTEVWDDWGEWTKKMLVRVDQQRAKRAGLSTRDIALSLQSQYAGVSITNYRKGDELMPVVARAGEEYRNPLWKIQGINVYSVSKEQSVPLTHIADVELTWQPSNIRRRDGTRTMTIKANVLRGAYPSEILKRDIQPAIRRLQRSGSWPAGYEVRYGGEFEKSLEANRSIMVNVPLAVGLMILVLVGQFNSVRRVLIIALTVPPMFVGVTGGMLLTGSPFGFMALLGIVSLVGIIVNNAIMMIDQIELDRARTQDPREALMTAAQRRFRPILMTASTTILGLVPLALQGGALWKPMANALIFGLAFSTILTLVLCPVLYSLFFGIGFREKP
jgi:multidrug efflux pump subunit AcrB